MGKFIKAIMIIPSGHSIGKEIKNFVKLMSRSSRSEPKENQAFIRLGERGEGR